MYQNISESANTMQTLAPRRTRDGTDWPGCMLLAEPSWRKQQHCPDGPLLKPPTPTLPQGMLKLEVSVVVKRMEAPWIGRGTSAGLPSPSTQQLFPVILSLPNNSVLWDTMTGTIQVPMVSEASASWKVTHGNVTTTNCAAVTHPLQANLYLDDS